MIQMSTQEILKSFELLPDIEKQKVITEILRRTVALNFPPLEDEELIQNAEHVFLEIERRESADDCSNQG